MQYRLRAIYLAHQPLSTLPGPTSMKCVGCCPIRRRIDSTHRTDPVTCRTSASCSCLASVVRAASTFVTTGTLGAEKLSCPQVLSQTVLRGLHQRAVEGRAHREHHNLLRSGFFCQHAGLLNGCHSA